MEKATLILQDPPYGTEKLFNALRYASALLAESIQVKVFLLGDAVAAAKKDQKTPQGFYNLASMLKGLAAKGVEVLTCGSCSEAWGLKEEELVAGVRIGRMVELARWSKESDAVLVF